MPLIAVPLVPAAEFAHRLANRPRHELLGVVSDRFLQFYPGLRQPGEIDGEDQRLHGDPRSKCLILGCRRTFGKTPLAMVPAAGHDSPVRACPADC